MLPFKVANDLYALFAGATFDVAVALSEKAAHVMNDCGAWELYAASLAQAGQAERAWPCYEKARSLMGDLPPHKRRILLVHRMLCYEFLASSTAAGAQQVRDDWL